MMFNLTDFDRSDVKIRIFQRNLRTFAENILKISANFQKVCPKKPGTLNRYGGKVHGPWREWRSRARAARGARTRPRALRSADRGGPHLDVPSMRKGGHGERPQAYAPS